MPAKKKTAKKKPSKTAKKNPARKKPAAKKRTSSKKSAVRKKTAAKATAARTSTARPAREKSFSVARPSSRRGLGSEAAGQSGDLQGLSRRRGADSESVEELLEEGNAFEADVVAGVEGAGADEKPVRTHEVPADDVPDEYLDRES